MDRYSIALNKKPTSKSALQRAQELMGVPQRELPPVALGYLYHQNNKYGACGEVTLTAFAHYAQAVEGLKTSNVMYKIDLEALNWFRNPVPVSYKNCTSCGKEELMIGNNKECSNCDLPF
jgi:hypothetical protein